MRRDQPVRGFPYSNSDSLTTRRGGPRDRIGAALISDAAAALGLPRPYVGEAVGLAVLAPLSAEVVTSSSTPAVLFPVVGLLLVLVYRLPALLLRELWVRRRIGWPGFVVLGVAYTALNEGVLAAT